MSGDDIDTTLNKGYGTNISNWAGSEAFENFMLVRKKSFEPEDYLEFRKDCAFKNTVIETDLYLENGYDPEIYKTLSQEIDQAVQKIIGNYKKIYDEYIRFFESLENKTDGDISFNQIVYEKGLQDGMELVLNHFRYYLNKTKNEVLAYRIQQVGLKRPVSVSTSGL